MSTSLLHDALELSPYEIYLSQRLAAPIKSHRDIGLLRNDIVKAIPSNIDKLFMPFTFNADPFWVMDVDEAYLNHPYEPFTVLLYVMRSHWLDLIDMVDGWSVQEESDYNRLCASFNEVFLRVKAGLGNGDERGLCSVDEMIRIASLFYIIQLSCCNKAGLILDEDGRFLNPWGKKKLKVDMKNKTQHRYAVKLRGAAVSGLGWSEFMFRYAKQTTKDSLWLVHLPKIEPSEVAGCAEFTINDFEEVLHSAAMLATRGKVLILTEKTEILAWHLGQVWKSDLKKSNLRLYSDFATIPMDYIAITNYDIETFEMLRG